MIFALLAPSVYRRFSPDLGRSVTIGARLRVISTPWFGVTLEYRRGRENGPHMHNHPWTWFEFVLFGRYTERISLDYVLDPAGMRGTKLNPIRWFNCGSKTLYHRVFQTNPLGCLSLVIRGRASIFPDPKAGRVLLWGYATPDGLRHNLEYDAYLEQSRR